MAATHPYLHAALVGALDLEGEDALLPTAVLLRLARGICTAGLTNLVRESGYMADGRQAVVISAHIVLMLEDHYPELRDGVAWIWNANTDALRERLTASFTQQRMAGLIGHEDPEGPALTIPGVVEQLLLQTERGVPHEPLVLLHCLAFDPEAYAYVTDLLEQDLRRSPVARRMLADML